jgi:cell division protein FtsA
MTVHDEVFAAADLGASKVVVALGRRTGPGVELLGVGTVEARGARRGNTVSIQDLADCVRAAREEAEVDAGVEASRVHVAIRPTHVRGGVQELRATVRGGVVHASHIRQLDRAAEGAGDRVALYRNPLSWRTGDEPCAEPPVGRSAEHVIRRDYVVWSSARSVEAAVRAGGPCVGAVVPAGVAAAWGVTSEDQRARGVAVIDQGAAGTAITVFRHGAVIHSAVVPLGGEDLTRNLAVTLRTGWDVAESVKVHHGTASASAPDLDAEILIPGVDGRAAQRRRRQLLAQVLEPRLMEVLSEARAEVESVEQGWPVELVITGGSSALPGFVDVAEQVFGRAVSLGIPGGCSGVVDSVRHPRYATVLGLLQLPWRLPVTARCAAGSREETPLVQLAARFRGWLRRAF